MRMKPLSRHLKSLCRQLGPEYRVTVIDLEYVINRDFGNGYDIEISGVNTSKADVIPRARGKQVDFRKCHLGPPEAVF